MEYRSIEERAIASQSGLGVYGTPSASREDTSCAADRSAARPRRDLPPTHTLAATGSISIDGRVKPTAARGQSDTSTFSSSGMLPRQTPQQHNGGRQLFVGSPADTFGQTSTGNNTGRWTANTGVRNPAPALSTPAGYGAPTPQAYGNRGAVSPSRVAGQRGGAERRGEERGGPGRGETRGTTPTASSLSPSRSRAGNGGAPGITYSLSPGRGRLLSPPKASKPATAMQLRGADESVLLATNMLSKVATTAMQMRTPAASVPRSVRAEYLEATQYRLTPQSLLPAPLGPHEELVPLPAMLASALSSRATSPADSVRGSTDESRSSEDAKMSLLVAKTMEYADRLKQQLAETEAQKNLYAEKLASLRQDVHDENSLAAMPTVLAGPASPQMASIFANESTANVPDTLTLSVTRDGSSASPKDADGYAARALRRSSSMRGRSPSTTSLSARASLGHKDRSRTLSPATILPVHGAESSGNLSAMGESSHRVQLDSESRIHELLKGSSSTPSVPTISGVLANAHAPSEDEAVNALYRTAGNPDLLRTGEAGFTGGVGGGHLDSAELSSLRRVVNVLQIENESLVSQSDNLRAMLQHLHSVAAEKGAVADQKIASLQEDVRQLTAELSSVEQISNRIAASSETKAKLLLEEIERGRNEIQQLQLRLRTLESTGATKETELVSTKAIQEALTKRLDEQASELIAIKAHQNGLTDENNSLREMVASLQKQLDQSKQLAQQREAEVEEMASTVATLEKTCDDARAGVLRLTAERDMLDDSCRHLQTTLTEKDARLNQLQAELQTQNEVISVHIERENGCAAVVKELESKNSGLSLHIAQLQNELASLRSTVDASGQEVQGNLASLRVLLQQRDVELENSQSQIVALQGRCSELEFELQGALQDRHKSAEALFDVTQQCHVLQQSIASKEQELDLQRNRNLMLATELADKQESQNQLRSNLEEAGQAIQDLTVEIERLVGENETVRARCLAAERQLDNEAEDQVLQAAAAARMKEAAASIEQLTDQVEQLSTETETLRSQLEQKDASIRRLESQLNDAILSASAVKTLQTEYNRVTDTLQGMQMERDSAVQRYEDAERQLAVLRLDKQANGLATQDLVATLAQSDQKVRALRADAQRQALREEDLLAKVHQSQLEYDRVGEQLRAAQAELRSVSSRLAEQSEENVRLSQMQYVLQENETLKMQLSEARETLTTLTEVAESLSTSTSHHGLSDKDVDDIKQEVTRLQSDLNKALRQASSVAKERDALLRRNAELEKVVHRNAGREPFMPPPASERHLETPGSYQLPSQALTMPSSPVELLPQSPGGNMFNTTPPDLRHAPPTALSSEKDVRKFLDIVIAGNMPPHDIAALLEHAATPTRAPASNRTPNKPTPAARSTPAPTPAPADTNGIGDIRSRVESLPLSQLLAGLKVFMGGDVPNIPTGDLRELAIALGDDFFLELQRATRESKRPPRYPK